MTYVETWNTGDRIVSNSDPDLLLDNFQDYFIAAHRDSTMLLT